MLNRLTQVTAGVGNQAIGYDANGNVITNGSASYSYDGFGRRIGTTVGGQSASYVYNAQDQRSSKTVDGVTTRFIYAGQNTLLAEHGGSGWTNYLWFGGELVGLVRNGQRYFVHTDQVGRPEIVTDTAKAVV